MPFQSEKQRRYLHANHPEIAKRWEKEYAHGGILDINASEEIISDDGNDIELTDYNAAFDDPNDLSTGVKSLFQAKDGGRIGFAKGDWSPGVAAEERAAQKSSGGGNNYQDRIQTIAQNQPSYTPTYSNPNEDRAREEKVFARLKAAEAKQDLLSRGEHADPILDMVGKKVVTDPSTGGQITVDDQAVFMPEKKLLLGKGKRPARWTTLEDKAYFDRLDNVVQNIKDHPTLSKRIADKAVNLIAKKAAMMIPFGNIILAIAKLLGWKPTDLVKTDIAGNVLEEEVTGADLGWFQDTDWEGVDPEFEKDWSELWDKGPDDTRGEAPELPPQLGGPSTEEMATQYQDDWYGAIKAGQQKQKDLLAKIEREKLAREENPIVSGTEKDIIMIGNSGGLANLFRVKNQ